MIGFPPVYLIYVAIFFELKSKGVIAVALSPLFYLSCIFWIMTGVGLRRMRQWSWYTFGAAQFFVTLLNIINIVTHSESEFKGYAFIFTLGLQYLIYWSVQREIRVPYLFPNIKWWESGIAGMNHLSADIYHSRSPTGYSNTQLLDLNGRGCFLKSPMDFEPNEKIKIKLSAYGQDVDLPGLIVWNAKSAVTHPKGVGIRFYDLNRTRRRKVKIISKRFEREKEKNANNSRLSS